jgi:hypothetical protein
MKTYLKAVTITLTALILAACGTPSSSSTPLTALTINGANDASINFDASFNFFTGVTATGNDGGVYTTNLTLSSISTAVNTTTGVLDSTKTGIHTVQYRVQVGALIATKFRNVTVGQPVSTGMLINPDFALGTAGWDDPGVVFNADGSAMVLSTENGALKAEVTAGANPYTPRFGQMNIPFEIDTTYEVSFRAKSSVIKPINLNVGELLTSAPWFTDFKPNQPEIRTIGTEWASFSYIFTHRLDNKRGGVLFELGKVSNQQVNATMYFDDIAIEETTAGPDVTAPILNGILPTRSILIGSTFNPLLGITAIDAVDGDRTSSIVVEIFNSSNAKVTTLSTAGPAVFTVKYSVKDAAGNEATGQSTINVVETLPKAQWVGYGGFSVSQTANNVTINYVNVPDPWYSDNAQLPVVGFDGSKSEINFQFTGVSGHNYLFKIEGAGSAKEVEIVGTGSAQTVKIPLSEFTSSQRAAFNLIIVFVKTPGLSGSIVINNWTY